MDAAEQIKKFQDFLEANYHAELMEAIRTGQNFLVIDFAELSKFDIDLANDMLESPEEVIKAAEIAVEQFDAPEDVANFRVRVKNLPESQHIMIRNIRAKHLGKLLQMEGAVRQKSDVRPQVTAAKFECPACGNVINVLQLDQKFKEPTRCSCGRKGKFRLLSKELIDAQGIVLEEVTDNLDGGEQPKRMNVFLKEDLVSPISDKKTNPGTKISITGFVKEIPVIMRSGSQSTRYDLIIEAVYMEPVIEDFSEINISKEDIKKINEIGNDPKVYQKLIEACAPSIYGYDKIKESILYQLAGGVKKTRNDGISTRGDIHILLIGDPGAGKCLSGDSNIVLEDGSICKIEDFFDKNKNIATDSESFSLKNDISLPSFGKSCKLEKNRVMRLWRRKTDEKLLKITTSSGNIIKVTKNHPFFTTKDGLVFSKQASNIVINDFIATPNRINVNTSIQPLCFEIEKSKSNKKLPIVFPQIMNNGLARFIGYLIGDGYVRFRKTTGVVSLTNNDLDLLNDFKKLLKNLFNLDCNTRVKKDTKTYEYYKCSIELTRFLEQIDSCILKDSGNTSIPLSIQKSPNNILKEFIKSFFDCEAHVSDREIQISSKSEKLIYELKIMLLRFNIKSQISKKIKYATNTINKTKRPYFELRITGIDVKKYNKEIGFVSNKKTKKLTQIITNKKNNNTNVDIVPNIKNILKNIRQKYNLLQKDMGVSRSVYLHYELGDRNPSKDSLKKIVNRLKLINKNDVFIKILEEITNADILWDKIKSIEEVTNNDEYVFDLEIDNTHNYISNGIMVHNSQLLKRTTKIAPKSRFVSGKGASGAGLTAAVVKDEFLGGWSLEAGALVLANRGVCCIDELDKMTDEDRSAMHEALEGQTITISKANIQATLRCETTVLAAANPKFGRFDPYDILAKQINLPPALISRFDLIFPIKDLPEEKKDARMASFILQSHKTPDVAEPEIDTLMLRKYVSYVRQHVSPQLTDEAIEEIKNYYVQMRNSASEDGGLKTVPITTRQLEALVRLAEAASKMRIGKEVTVKDAKRAIDLLNFCLAEVGMDPDTGKIDIDRITSGISSSARNKIGTVKEIISELENKIGKAIPIENIIEEAKSKGMDEDEVEDVIDKLKRGGDIFEPKRGVIQRL